MENTTPMKAIRLKCLDCCCGSSYEVERCSCPNCALYPFRFGKNPNIGKREYSEEARNAMRERMAKLHSARNTSK